MKKPTGRPRKPKLAGDRRSVSFATKLIRDIQHQANQARELGLTELASFSGVLRYAYLNGGKHSVSEALRIKRKELRHKELGKSKAVGDV